MIDPMSSSSLKSDSENSMFDNSEAVPAEELSALTQPDIPPSSPLFKKPIEHGLLQKYQLVLPIAMGRVDSPVPRMHLLQRQFGRTRAVLSEGSSPTRPVPVLHLPPIGKSKSAYVQRVHSDLSVSLPKSPVQLTEIVYHNVSPL